MFVLFRVYRACHFALQPFPKGFGFSCEHKECRLSELRCAAHCNVFFQNFIVQQGQGQADSTMAAIRSSKRVYCDYIFVVPCPGLALGFAAGDFVCPLCIVVVRVFEPPLS